MQDLRLVGIHEDGEHLLLAGPDGARFRVPLDDELREAARPGRPRPKPRPAREESASTEPAESVSDEPTPLRPRDVQGLIREGVDVEEIARRSGWEVEKVRRYEPPIRAERDYVSGLAQAVRLRGRDAEHTLADRVGARLAARGVEAERVTWDAWRTPAPAAHWLVACVFPAGGRERRATWRFDPKDRALSAADDEARWLGEDEQAQGPVPAPPVAPPSRSSRVYDVEAEGGLAAQERRPKRGSARPAQEPPAGSERHPSVRAGAQRAERPVTTPPERSSAPAGDSDEDARTVDLVSAMRERSAGRRRSTSKTTSRRSPAPTDTPIPPEDMPEQARPTERLRVASTPPPPGGSRGHDGPDADQDLPHDELVDGVAHDEAHEDVDAPDTSDTSGTPDLRHDPVTGTADLFDDLELVAGGPAEDDEAAPITGRVRSGRGRRNRRSGRRAERAQTSTETEDDTDTDSDTDEHEVVPRSTSPDDAAPEVSEQPAAVGTPEQSLSEPESQSSPEAEDDRAQRNADSTAAEKTATEDESTHGTGTPAKSTPAEATQGKRAPAQDKDAPSKGAPDADAADASGKQDDEPETAPSVPARQSGSRRKRPAVPSWDDIMFGGRGPDS